MENNMKNNIYANVAQRASSVINDQNQSDQYRALIKKLLQQRIQLKFVKQKWKLNKKNPQQKTKTTAKNVYRKLQISDWNTYCKKEDRTDHRSVQQFPKQITVEKSRSLIQNWIPKLTIKNQNRSDDLSQILA